MGSCHWVGYILFQTRIFGLRKDNLRWLMAQRSYSSKNCWKPSCLFWKASEQPVHCSCYKAKLFQERFEEHNKAFKEKISIPLNICGIFWTKRPHPSDLILLLTYCCQIPLHTFGGLVKSRPPQVRAVLAAKGPAQQQAAGLNVMAEYYGELWLSI